jgi:hypothetical protein
MPKMRFGALFVPQKKTMLPPVWNGLFLGVNFCIAVLDNRLWFLAREIASVAAQTPKQCLNG